MREVKEARLNEKIKKMEIETKFNKLIGSLTEREYKSYVESWFDDQIVCDIMRDWDEDIKIDAIKELEEIIKKRNK